MVEIEAKEVKKVLKNTKLILKHHKELMRAKGEHFNLFSILNIETKENKTHSAFLSMLLNPKGAHGMGNVFLNLFLNVIGHNDQFENDENRFFQTDKSNVKVEHSIGPIKLCDKNGEDASEATGGRIDIYLKDKKGNSISIENKIHAEDQKSQIQRYCNHNGLKNTVYYLTLIGDDPSDYSKLKLESGIDFYNISYKVHIIEWLELCLKEVPNFTALRESINQYILLIKKITNTLNDKAEKELFDTMVENIEESRFIANNYQKLLNEIRENFRKELVTRLVDKLDKTRYSVKSELPVNQNYSKLWIHYENLQHVPFSFCVEPFSASGNSNGAMFVGLYGHKNAVCSLLPDPNRLNDVWRHVSWLQTPIGNSLHLNSPNLLRILYATNSNEYKNLVATTVSQVIEFINETEPYIFKEFNT